MVFQFCLPFNQWFNEIQLTKRCNHIKKTGKTHLCRMKSSKKRRPKVVQVHKKQKNVGTGVLDGPNGNISQAKYYVSP